MKKKFLLLATAAFCMVMAMGLMAGCGSSSDSTTTDEAAVTDISTDETATDTTATDTSTAASTFDTVMAQMTECYAGLMSDGATTVYYAGGQDGSLAIVAMLDSSSAVSASYVGTAVVDSTSGTVTVTDSTTGNAIAFTSADNGDGTMTLDFGDLGTATVSAASTSDMAAALSSISEGTTAVQ